MSDLLTAEQRSACMRAVRPKDTDPEMRVRRLVHRLGFRYSLHAKNLPGKPDLALVARRKIIFVHGCFWHNHTCRRGRVAPVHNAAYWSAKRTRNRERDRSVVSGLRKAGWQVLVIWECWTRDEDSLRNRLQTFLSS